MSGSTTSANWVRPIADGEVATTLPLHPPADVTAALTTLQHACAGWVPALVAVKQSGPPVATPLEVLVCHYIADPAGEDLAAFELGAGLVTAVVLLAVFGWFAFRLGEPCLSRLWRFARCLCRRARA